MTHITLLSFHWWEQARQLSWLPVEAAPLLTLMVWLLHNDTSSLQKAGHKLIWTTGHLFPWAGGSIARESSHTSHAIGRNRQPKDYTSGVGSLLVPKACLGAEIPKRSTHAALCRRSCGTVQITQLPTQLLRALKWAISTQEEQTIC